MQYLLLFAENNTYIVYHVPSSINTNNNKNNTSFSRIN